MRWSAVRAILLCELSDQMRIGIVQTEVEIGDFSAHLRRLVQGARLCMDRGAEFLFAPAQGLDGAWPGALRSRSSFMLQGKAALQALADELPVPMLLASYAGELGEATEFPSPYLVGRGEVRRLPVHRTTRVCGMRVWIDTMESPIYCTKPVDLLLHLPSQTWHADLCTEWAAHARRESDESGAAVGILQAVAYADGCLMGGGSLLCAHGGKLLRFLPEFAATAVLWKEESAAWEHVSPKFAAARTLRAIQYALRNAVEQGGYSGIAVPASFPHAELLLAIALRSCSKRSVRVLQAGDRVGSLRMQAAAMQDAADEQCLLLLNGASRDDFLLGRDHVYAAGSLAPFGDLHDSEIVSLAQLVWSSPCSTPPAIHVSSQERALRSLVDENRSPAEISVGSHVDEGELRTLTRMMYRAAQRAGSHIVPRILRLHKWPEPFPVYHRLME